MTSSILDIFHSIPLICAFVGWLLAQVLKMVVSTAKNKKFTFVSLTASGGMPSSHSTSVCALATSIGMTNGFDSAAFAICVIFSYIVMYDAAGVRYQTGMQSKILNKMMQNIDEGKLEDNNKQLKELVGHTPMQVVVGALLGIFIGIIGSLISIT